MQIQLTASDRHKLNAYVAGPEDAQSGIVVVQEIFGVNSHMRNVADQFAAQGYRVICPALFDRAETGVELGYTPEDVKRGLELRSKIAEGETLLDIEAAASAFAPAVKLGIVGYCWGGTIAWLAACRSRRFSASSCWYGGGIAQSREETPQIPVQMHFGLEDGSIPPQDIALIQAAQPGVDIHTYPGAGHGFGCEQRGSFHPQSAALAQKRTLAFFQEHLKR